MKRILLLFAVVLTALQLSAADVSSTQAQAVANAFLKKQVATGRLKASAASNLQLVKAEASVARPEANDYYIFNSAKSYVVVAGDDQAPQILMYGEEGALDLDNVPPGMQWLLNKYKYQIDGLKAGTLEPVKIPKFATTAVAPLVTANWDQTAPYYNHTPTSGSTHAYTGCPATSLSMCFYKYNWPDTYPALPAIAANSQYGYLAAAALSEKAADWDNIIDEYTGPTNYTYTSEQADAVAWLMRYVGQTCEMGYSTSGSGANDPEIHQACITMGYTDAQLLTLTELVSSGWSYTNGEQQYTDAQWNEWMLNELQNGRPIEYLAYDISGYSVSGHAFNVFGVNSSGQYYVNWGWSGDSNGYCTLHNFTTATGATGQSGSYVFNYGEAMIIGIEPPAGATTTPKIKVNPSTLTMSTTVGTPVTSTFTVTGANLTSNIALSLSGDNAFSLSTTSISASQSESGVTVTVTYNPTAAGSNEATVTLTSTDAEAVTVKLNGNADPTPLETYAPVMLDATNITSTSFTATWTDATPAENVESYTLYVSSKPIQPEVALLDTTDWTSGATLPTGWTQSGLTEYSSNSACYLSSTGYVQSKTYDLTGYDKMTVMVYAEPYRSPYTLTVATSVDTKTVTMPSGASFAWYTIVVDCATSDYVKLTAGGLPDMRYMRVYAGDLTTTQLKASETGDATYRVITGITNKSYTVTGLTEGGTFNFYVVANYTNTAIGTSNTKQVTLLENTNPAITVNPAALDMVATVGETVTATFNVTGVNLTGDVTLALNDENGVYSITPNTISAADAMNGVDVTVTYTPTAFGTNNATVTLTSADAEDVTVTLNGTANLVKNAPVMLEANDAFVALTQFRAEWTDKTPVANVSSYTLEVNAKPEQPAYTEVGNADFSSLSAVTNTSGSYTNQISNASTYLPTGWSATTYLYIKDGAVVSRAYNSNYGTIVSPTYDFTGYDKVTVVVNVQRFNADDYTDAIVEIASSMGSQQITFSNTSDYATFTVVLDVAQSDNITLKTLQSCYALHDITIYAGDRTAALNMLMASETGGADYRLIEGIDPGVFFYTVKDLTAGGTFLYRVKALYVDGTESDWSNVEEVTLHENDHPYALGDVNHDGVIDVSDVTMTIGYILGNDNGCCLICADVNDDGEIDVADVTAMISLILTSTDALNLKMPADRVFYLLD